MAKKQSNKKTLEVGKDLTGDAILGNGNTIHKTIIQNINFSEKPSSDTEDLRMPEEKIPSRKQVSVESEYSNRIKQNIESITFNSALLWEHIDPQIARRKTQAQLRYIFDLLLHVDYEDPFNNAEFAKKRIAEFNKITGWGVTEHDIRLIDFFLGHPDQIPVWLVFAQIHKDGFQKEWEIYKSIIEGKQYAEFKKEGEDIYKQINEWLQNKSERIYKVVKRNFPDVSPEMPSLIPLEF